MSFIPPLRQTVKSMTMHLRFFLSAFVRVGITSRLLRCPLAFFTSVTLLFAAASAPAAEGGVITGSISNSATGNLLEGAKVEVVGLGLTTLTDNTGRFVLGNMPRVRTNWSFPTSAWIPPAPRSPSPRASGRFAISISPRPSTSSTPSKSRVSARATPRRSPRSATRTT